MSGDAWARANAALLEARGLAALPEAEARALLALLHAGTLVELDDPAALARLDLERLRLSRALAAGTLDEAGADGAAVLLLALGHREPARARRASSARVAGAWAAWVGDAPGEAGPAPLELDAVRLAPAAAEGRLALEVGARSPGRVAFRRLRVGGTTLDLEVRWRAGATVVRVQRTHGDALVLDVAFPAGATVTADDVPLPGRHARLELRERHEVVAYA